MNKTICIVSAGRSDYSLLKPVIKEWLSLSKANVYVLLIGEFRSSPPEVWDHERLHFVFLHGDERDDFSKEGMIKEIGESQQELASILQRIQPHLLIVLGDRYEIFACATVAFLLNIPIAHLHGGERTNGAIDDTLRHCVTLLSSYHFVACAEYGERVRQLGVPTERIFNVGAFGLEAIRMAHVMTEKQFREEIGFHHEKPFVIVTYHPVTMVDSQISAQEVKEMLDVLRQQSYAVIITGVNHDPGRNDILPLLLQFVDEDRTNRVFIERLGARLYPQALRYCQYMIGNSSSAFYEAPLFCKPAVNIGLRQDGRVAGPNIISCRGTVLEIERAIQKALNCSFQKELKGMAYPFGNGTAAQQTVHYFKEHWNEKWSKLHFKDL